MSIPNFNYPKNEEDFQNLINYVDTVLKNKGIPIFARPVHAVAEICKLLRISLRLTSDRPAVPGVFDSDSFSAHISDWYKKRYGDRLLIDFSPGSIAALIKGDPWKIKFPMIYGRVKLTFDPDLDKYKEPDDIAINAPIQINALKSIKGLTSEIAKSLTQLEMLKLSKFYMTSFDALQRLFEIKDRPFISEARSDLNSAVDNIFLTHPSFGQSKWSSLQFTEKLFKSFLKIKNVSIPLIHDLKQLADLAMANGLPSFDTTILEDIQCKAGVRYGEITVTPLEAIKAHHASIKICSLVVHAIKGDIPHLQETQNASKSPAKISPGLFYTSSIPNNIYYCKKIEGDLVHWFLIEMFQHGNSSLQCSFTAYLKDCIDYTLLTDPFEIIRLNPILHNYEANLEKDKGKK